MNIRLFSVTLALCFVFGGLFASCGKDSTNSGNDTDTGTSAYIEIENETALKTEAETLETVPHESISNEEIRTPIENEKALSFIEFQYTKALEAISLAKGQLSYDYNTEIVSEDGRICYPITDSVIREELDSGVINSFDTLSKYLRSIFARSIADDLIDISREFYTDVDGSLCLITDRMADGFETEELEDTEKTPVESESQNEEESPIPAVASTEFFLSDFTEKLFRYTAKVIFEGTDGAESVEYFDFIFENTGSGWYFTSFPALPQ